MGSCHSWWSCFGSLKYHSIYLTFKEWNSPFLRLLLLLRKCFNLLFSSNGNHDELWVAWSRVLLLSWAYLWAFSSLRSEQSKTQFEAEVMLNAKIAIGPVTTRLSVSLFKPCVLMISFREYLQRRTVACFVWRSAFKKERCVWEVVLSLYLSNSYVITFPC